MLHQHQPVPNTVDKFGSCVILGFRREVDQNCARLGCCAAYSGNLPTFRYQSVAFSGLMNRFLILEPWKKGAHDGGGGSDYDDLHQT